MKILHKIKMFIAKVFFSDLYQANKQSMELNRKLLEEIHDNKVYITCKSFDINSDEFLSYIESLYYDEKFVFLMTVFRDAIIKELVVAQEDKLDKLRGQLQGIYLIEGFIKDSKNRSSAKAFIKNNITNKE